jgi:hypothetical protein
MMPFRALVVGLFVVGFAAGAQAAPIVFVDTYAPASPVFLTDALDEHLITHNILTDVVVNGSYQAVGYSTATDVLSTASVALSFLNGNQGNDVVQIFFDDVQQGVTHVISSNTLGISVQVSFLALDGVLELRLVKDRNPGDFSFTGSVLTVDGTREVNGNPDPQVPEPATLLLMGVGLFLGAARRRQSRAA